LTDHKEVTEMRSEKEMMDVILHTAQEDDRVRAVILNGSRVNPNAEKDMFQDYDVIYVVKKITSFTSDHSWVDIFGERLMMQMPEDKVLPPPLNDGRFNYQMLFADGNRIDLTLIPVEKKDELSDRDSLSMILLDKDGIIEPFPPASDADYVIQPPSAKEFDDVCNEFWWCSTNVAKGLWRQELPYVKVMYEQPVRGSLILMLKWHVGIKTDFTKSAGKFGKYFKYDLEPDVYEQFVATYPDGEYENIWRSLFMMCDLFRKIAVGVAEHFGYPYPHGDDERITAYLKRVKLLASNEKGDVTTALHVWNDIMKRASGSGFEAHTRPLNNRIQLWFRVRVNGNALEISEALSHQPSVRLSVDRNITLKDFELVYSYYDRWIKGETGARQEVTRHSQNTTYIFSLIADHAKTTAKSTLHPVE
jgi:aminoglycoside 6-adenylyltransferase